jgi:hypothetical protein
VDFSLREYWAGCAVALLDGVRYRSFKVLRIPPPEAIHRRGVTDEVAKARGRSNGHSRVYSFHSGAQGGCPGLDWHVVAQGTSLEGIIAWNNMKDMAHATGTLNPTAKTFQMTAKEVGGQGRTATITGSVQSNGYLVANIKGPSVNCQNVTVQWFAPYQGAG